MWIWWFFKKEKQEEWRIQEVAFIVDDTDKNTLFEKTDTKTGRIANYWILLLIFISIWMLMFESIEDNWQKYLIQIFILDAIISILFGAEYVYRFLRSDDKKKFPFRIMNIFHLLSFLPFFVITLLYWMGNYTILALFRLFRVFKIFELLNRLPILLKLSRGIYKHKVEYGAWFFIITIILVFFATLVYFFENTFGWSEAFSSVPATLWWAVVTMTTVGYGDVIPLTPMGRILWGILMFLWPIVIAIMSSLTVLIFLESTKMISYNWKSKECIKCWTSNTKDSEFCKRCGVPFEM